MSTFGMVGLGLLTLFWLIALAAAMRRRGDGRFRIRPDQAPPEGPARLAVVIPARDEVGNIGPCVEAVLAQEHADLHITVLDDGSTDGTSRVLAGLAAAHPERLTVLTGGGAPLPDGWYGKPWACQRAAEAALAADPGARYLLFIDADVRLGPAAARAALGYMREHELGMVSGFGKLEMVSFWEKVMQPVVAGMIISGNPLPRVNDPEKRRGKPIANGQFILLSRETYEAVGGHAAVREDVLDDVGMATAVTASGAAYHMTFMTSVFTCRMYAGFSDLWEGWTKNLFPGLGWSWGALVGLLVFTGLTSLLPYALVLVGVFVDGPLMAWAAAIVLIIQALRLYLDRAFDQDLAYGLTHGPATLLLCVLLVRSAVHTSRGRATWKGRTLSVGQASADGKDST